MASVAALSCRVEDAGTIKPFLDMINSETSRINQIIDDMLELSHFKWSSQSGLECQSS
jgi:hypothetical protein